MDEHQLVGYPRSGTCSLGRSVCCVPLIFFPFKYPFQIPKSQPKLKVLLPLKALSSCQGIKNFGVCARFDRGRTLQCF